MLKNLSMLCVFLTACSSESINPNCLSVEKSLYDPVTTPKIIAATGFKNLAENEYNKKKPEKIAAFKKEIDLCFVQLKKDYTCPIKIEKKDTADNKDVQDGQQLCSALQATLDNTKTNFINQYEKRLDTLKVEFILIDKCSLQARNLAKNQIKKILDKTDTDLSVLEQVYHECLQLNH